MILLSIVTYFKYILKLLNSDCAIMLPRVPVMVAVDHATENIFK